MGHWMDEESLRREMNRMPKYHMDEGTQRKILKQLKSEEQKIIKSQRLIRRWKWIGRGALACTGLLIFAFLTFTGEGKDWVRDLAMSLQSDTTEEKIAGQVPEGIREELKNEFQQLPPSYQGYFTIGHMRSEFNNNEGFRERLKIAAMLSDHLTEEQFLALLDLPPKIGPEYLRMNGKIHISNPNLKVVYEQFQHEVTANDQLTIKSLLRDIGNEFYLSQNGTPVEPTDLKDFGMAKEWSTGASDFRLLNEKIRVDIEKKLTALNQLSHITSAYRGHLHDIITNLETGYSQIKQGVQSEQDYAIYYGVGRDLFILEDIINQPLPIEFSIGAEEISNEEYVNRILNRSQTGGKDRILASIKRDPVNLEKVQLDMEIRKIIFNSDIKNEIKRETGYEIVAIEPFETGLMFTVEPSDHGNSIDEFTQKVDEIWKTSTGDFLPELWIVKKP